MVSIWEAPEADDNIICLATIHAEGGGEGGFEQEHFYIGQEKVFEQNVD